MTHEIEDDEPQAEPALPPITEADKGDLGFGKPVTEPERLARHREIMREKVEAAEKAAGITKLDE